MVLAVLESVLEKSQKLKKNIFRILFVDGWGIILSPYPLFIVICVEQLYRLTCCVNPQFKTFVLGRAIHIRISFSIPVSLNFASVPFGKKKITENR